MESLQVFRKPFRMSVRLAAISLTTAVTAGSTAVVASLPAPDEAILCSSTHVVVGTVLDAHEEEDPSTEAFCRRAVWSCGYGSSCQSNPHSITLHVKVNTILGSTAHKTFAPSPWYTNAVLEKVSVGDTVSVSIKIYNSVCGPATWDHQGMFSVDPPVRGKSPMDSLTQDVLHGLYVGKQFVFSVEAVRRSGLAPNAPYYGPPGVFTSGVWKMDRLAWAVETLRHGKGVSCPKPGPAYRQGRREH